MVDEVLETLIQPDPLLLSWGRRVTHQVVTDIAVCHYLLQFQCLQKLPDCWVGAVDKIPGAVVPSLCNVGAPGQTAKGSIPMVPGNLTKERRAGRGPKPCVLHEVSKVTHLSRKGRTKEPPRHVNVTAGKNGEGSDHLEGFPHSRSIDLVHRNQV